MCWCSIRWVTEAFNADEEEFGVERLEEVIQAHAAGSAEDIVAAIEAAVDAFVGDVPPFDDFTLVVLKRVKDEGGGLKAEG